MQQEQSCLQTETKDFELEAHGKNKKEAFGTAFAKFKKAAYASVDGLIIHMEPDDVFIHKYTEKTTTQRFMGYFAPKEIQNVTVSLRITATIKYIPN